MTHVAVCIPTIDGREAEIERTAAAYYAQETDGIRVGLHVVKRMSWGGGCNHLARELSAYPDIDYLLFGCDDAVPRNGCLHAAIEHHRKTGHVPGARFYENGAPLDPSYDARAHGETSPWTRLFFVTPLVWQRVGPLLDLTWYTDIDWCQRLTEAGYVISMCDGFEFDHLDPPRTWAENGEADRQHAVYREACVAAGRSPLA